MSRLFQFVENFNCRRISLELISWGPHSSLDREKKFVDACLRPPSQKCTKNHDAREKWLVLLNKPIAFFDVLVALAVVISEFTQQDGRKKRTAKRLCDKRDIAITCEFCRELRLTILFSGLYKKTRLKESEVWRKVISNKTVGTHGLPSSFLSRPVA